MIFQKLSRPKVSTENFLNPLFSADNVLESKWLFPNEDPSKLVSMGVCSGERQMTSRPGCCPDGCLCSSAVDLVSHESTVPNRGGTAGWSCRGEEVRWCWMILWSLSFWDGEGANRKQMPEWFRGSKHSDVYPPVWVAVITLLLACLWDYFVGVYEYICHFYLFCSHS